ncbi:hypothetical protein LXL04_007399 [Taraxacum kok-saghyz]
MQYPPRVNKSSQLVKSQLDGQSQTLAPPGICHSRRGIVYSERLVNESSRVADTLALPRDTKRKNSCKFRTSLYCSSRFASPEPLLASRDRLDSITLS